MDCYFAEPERKIIKDKFQLLELKKLKCKKTENFSNQELNNQVNNNINLLKDESFPGIISGEKHTFLMEFKDNNKGLYQESETKFKKDYKQINDNKTEIDKFNNNNLEQNGYIKPKLNGSYFKYTNNPINIHLIKELTNDSYIDYPLDNTFIVNTSVDDIIYLIYSTNKNSIIFYNIIDNKKINEIKKAHNKDITNLKHFLDKKKKRDLILSISLSDNNLKIWDLSTFDCLINISNVNQSGRLFSACIFCENTNNYILTSSAYSNTLESIKVFDFNGIKIKEISDSNDNDNIYFIDTYEDNKTSKIYILTGNNGYMKSYDYTKNKIYHKYSEDDNRRHCSIIIKNVNAEIRMIESSFDGHIRIWDFHSSILIKKIKITDNNWLLGICLWNDDYLFVGCGDKTIKLVDLKNEAVINNISGNKNKILTLKTLFHPKYGKCLVSQGYEKEQIKLYVI